MASLFTDDERPKSSAFHEIGQDLTALSLSDLDERIEMLQGEIARLMAARRGKDASKAAADAFFRNVT